MSTRPTPSLDSLADRRIVLYDGVCHLCDTAVRFILPRDPRGVFQFAPLQGDLAAGVLTRHGIPRADPPESILLVERGRVFSESSAILRICSKLRFPWNLLAIFLLIPPPIRNGVYRWVARNRYRWFGKEDQCLLPQAKWRDRFLDSTRV